MSADHILWVWAIALAGAAGWLDWRSRRIPNWLTVSSCAAGVAANAVLGGWRGALNALEGAGLALGILLPLVLLKALGAGDWKLMAALGSALGPHPIGLVLLVSIFVAGFMAAVQITYQRRWQLALANIVELVRGVFEFGLKPHPWISLDNPSIPSLPFGVAAAGATLLCFWMAKF